MSTSSITRARPWPYRLERGAGTGSAAGGARAALAGTARLVLALVGEDRTRRAARHLMTLDDHMLRDIGLERAGIGRAVRTGRASSDRARRPA